MLPGDQGRVTSPQRLKQLKTCDYIWDKLYPPISVTSSKWYIRKAPFVLSAQPLDMSTESLLACLINLLPESFGALSVSV
jgi:hypothetical protein